MDVSREGGFTLIELLVVVVVLGIIAAAAVFAVTGLTASAEERSCTVDRDVLERAVVAFQELSGNSNIKSLGPKDDPDRFEKRLIDEGLLLEPSKYHFVKYSGKVVAAGDSPCTNN